jgi:hypothetical protein
VSRPLVLLVFLSIGLTSCGTWHKTDEPLDPVDNVADAARGARAISSPSQPGFPTSNLNDASPAPWGAAEGRQDTYAAVVLPAPQAVRELRIWLFSPEQPPRPHLRDIRIVAADSDEPGGPAWRVVRSRLSTRGAFSEKITVPPSEDGTVIVIELDASDPNWGPHAIWGFACLSASRGDARNYLKDGTGIYVRELQMR